MSQWFPMRVTYNRELKVQQRFNELNIRTFIPMRYEIVLRQGHRKRALVPAVHNLIFVRAQRQELSKLKSQDPLLNPLRYMTQRSHLQSEQTQIIIVPDDQMENFINVSQRVDDDRVQYLEYTDYIDKPGQRVKIIDGDFAGTYGVIKRIKKNRQVVVTLSGLIAVTLNSIPFSYVAKVDDDEAD